jgi:hypothetical protein
MDAKLFRLPSEPILYSQVTPGTAQKASMVKVTPSKSYAAGPGTDVRFPGWAPAGQEDGRLVTDYRPRCYENIQPHTQFASHQWIQHNTDDIIRISRARLSEQTGANRGFDNTVVAPPAAIVECDQFVCRTTATGLHNGVGTQRQEVLPPLFGTFNDNVPTSTQYLPPITREFLGGRNTPRGRMYTDLGTGGVANVNKNGVWLKT